MNGSSLLLGDSSDSDSSSSPQKHHNLKVNSRYATAYTSRKRREELSSAKDRGLDISGGRIEGESDESDR